MEFELVLSERFDTFVVILESSGVKCILASLKPLGLCSSIVITTMLF